MKQIPFLWSNDDIGHGQAPQLKRQLDFLAQFGIPGTFFLVPKSSAGTLDGDPELLRLIESARGQGHEFYQHGYLHTAFECGVPATWMLDFAPDVRQRYDDERLAIEAGHTFEAQIRMLEAGQRIWRRAFGEDSAGFRPPWGAFCTNFYRALDALGYQWVSSRLPCAASWRWNQGEWDAPVDFRPAVPAAPCQIEGGGVWELPISGGDYAFHVPHEEERIEAMSNLGMEEFAYCHERGIPFMMVCHWHGLARNDDSGYAVHQRLLPRIIESGKAELMAAGALYQRTQASKE